MIFADIFAVIYYHRHTQWHFLGKLLPSMVIGVLIGVWIGNDIPELLFKQLMAALILLTVVVIYSDGFTGVYALVGISAAMSLMFPTIFGLGIAGLGEDTKIGGAGMVMAIAGAAFLTQIQGMLSDSMGSIKFAFWVPAIAFLIIAAYGMYARKLQKEAEMEKVID